MTPGVLALKSTKVGINRKKTFGNGASRRLYNEQSTRYAFFNSYHPHTQYSCWPNAAAWSFYFKKNTLSHQSTKNDVHKPLNLMVQFCQVAVAVTLNLYSRGACPNLRRPYWLSWGRGGVHVSPTPPRLLQTSGTVPRLCHKRFLPVTFHLTIHQYRIARLYYSLRYRVTK